MNNAASVDQVRRLAVEGLRELGLADAEGGRIQESVLIRGGYYAGRRFSCSGISALWIADQGKVSFRDDHGRLLKTIAVEPERAAA